MTKHYEIKNFENVLKESLKPDETVANYTGKPFLDPGENYGSMIMGVTVTIKNKETNKLKTLKVIAKMVPKNESFREMFNVYVTVKKEINMYTIVIQELERFANEYNFPEQVDFLCKYYGSRLSLDETSTTVDEDAILILENLKESGYEMVDRLIGFDLETAKIVLNNLALFHALPIAFKLKKPKEFNHTILPLLEPNFDKKMADKEPDRKLHNIEMYQYAIEANPECAKYESILLEKLNKPRMNHTVDALNDPFSTICHMDFWTNNIMMKYNNGVPVKSKLIDFQMYLCESLARDLFFFLFSSVQIPVLNKHYDELLQHYQRRFIKILDCFSCNTEIYTLERFHAEMKNVFDTEIGHVLFMIRVIMADRGSVTDLENTDPEMIFNSIVSNKYKQRLADVILTFAKKRWL